MYSGAAVCVCVCLSFPRRIPHFCSDPYVTLRNGRGAPWLCTIGQICNWCMGFVAIATYAPIAYVTEDASSWLLYGWFEALSLLTIARLFLALLLSCSSFPTCIHCVVCGVCVYTVASQPINEGGQSPGAPKVQGAPKCYL